MKPNISVKARLSVAGTSRKRAAPYLERWATTTMLEHSSLIKGFY